MVYDRFVAFEASVGLIPLGLGSSYTHSRLRAHAKTRGPK